MCGIAGFAGLGDHSDLERMAKAIAHRGPDGEGFYQDSDTRVFLGHRRLSIIDIAGGAQPMWNAEKTIGVVFNGEIYNHLELRRELEAKGHRFKSDHSDTEVLVHGWREWGEELPARLNGMFGFALYDKEHRQIFLARDRFGEKPLYWARQDKLFLFASELSAIAAHTGFPADLDRTALKKYYAHGFIPAPNALYKNAFKLPAGNWLRYDLRSESMVQRSYWRFRTGFAAQPPSFEEAAEELRRLLIQSVKRRLMSDVPLGVLLSGGVDSSAAAACVKQIQPEEGLMSFSIGFEEKSFDESEFARTMAQAIGSDHYCELLSLDRAHEMMASVLGRLDEPLGDPSILPTYLLCGFVRSKVKVALSGDGGDELFAGYDPFAALRSAQIYSATVPRLLHRGMRRLVELIPKSDANMSLDFKLRRALSGLDYGPELWNPVWLAPLETAEIAELFNEPVDPEELYSEVLALWREDPDKGLIDKSLEFYTNFYLSDNILTKVDRAAMLHGLEVRSVFLDNDLAEFVRFLPASYKYRRGERKSVLKKALDGLVPTSILHRPKKGFGIPLAAWLRAMGLDAEGARETGMNSDFIMRRIQAHKRSKQDHRLFLWCWSAFQRQGHIQA